MTEEEFREMTKGVDYYYNAVDACINGMATHVHLGEYIVEAEQFFDFKDSGFEDFNEYMEYVMLEALEEAGIEVEIEEANE
jgi:hypothetical protein